MTSTLSRPVVQTLTTGQLNALQAITDPAFIDARCKASISGPAGTGKTVLIAQILKELDQYAVAVAAPTHKAAAVLQQKFQEFGVEIYVPLAFGGGEGSVMREVRTIHSLLGLQPKRIIPGQPEDFTRNKSGSTALANAEVLVIDECSMIGTKLYEYMMEAVENYNLALLCVGDPFQLQPVNEYKKSKCFSVGDFYELDEVVRHDGAILKVATMIRSRRNFIPQFVDRSSGESRVQTYATEDDLKEAWLDELEQDPSANIQMVCWKNDIRRDMNKAARLRLYGEDVPQFQAGDTIVALSHHACNKFTDKFNEFVNPRMLVNNEYTQIKTVVYLPDYSPCHTDSKSGKITRTSITTIVQSEFEEEKTQKEFCYPAWVITDTQDRTYAVLDPSAIERYKKDLSAMSRAIKAKEKALNKEIANGKYVELKRIIGRLWATLYFPLKEAFADVDFGYACTIHKSQGSTFEQVFVWPDYTLNKRERSQLLYVAVTRARLAVHHIYTGLNR